MIALLKLQGREIYKAKIASYYLLPFLSNLTYLEYSSDVHLNTNILPDTLVFLKLSGYRNIPIDGVIPKSVKYLYIYCNLFNQDINGVLHEGLVYLEFRDNLNKFDQEINDLPKTLKVLKINDAFNSPINSLPNSLEELIFPVHGKFNKKLIDLPKGLKKLYLPSGYWQEIKAGDLPESLTDLRIQYHYKNNNIIKKCVLPLSLQKLICSLDIEMVPGVFPEGLKYLEFGNNNQQELLVNVLPDNLETLVIDYQYKKKFDDKIAHKGIKKIICCHEQNFGNTCIL